MSIYPSLVSTHRNQLKQIEQTINMMDKQLKYIADETRELQDQYRFVVQTIELIKDRESKVGSLVCSEDNCFRYKLFQQMPHVKFVFRCFVKMHL